MGSYSTVQPSKKFKKRKYNIKNLFHNKKNSSPKCLEENRKQNDGGNSSQASDQQRYEHSLGLASKKRKLSVTVQESSTFTSSDLSEKNVDIIVTEKISPNFTEDIENNESDKLNGNRIVDIHFLFSQIKELNKHCETFGCTINNLIYVSERRNGLNSTFTYTCNMCNEKFNIYSSNPKETIGLNYSAVLGTLSAGLGYTQLQEICMCIDVPCMSNKTFMKTQNQVFDNWTEVAQNEMKKAVQEEAALAVERGDVDTDGVPLLTVIVDGCWSKRSYRMNYNALSGAAAIVGYYTKKVLYMEVKNKYCVICVRAELRNEEPKLHICYRNHFTTSSRMETDIIVKGFQISEKVHGVRYYKVIGDGDSSVYKNILDSKPYKNLVVEKIECRNHLLRNYCTKLRQIVRNTQFQPPSIRQLVGSNILKLRRAVTSALKYHKDSSSEITAKIKQLQADIVNSPYHIFGQHKNCAAYFCKSSNTENFVQRLEDSGIWDVVVEHATRLSFHARSLIHDVQTNPVEQYNGIIAKFIGGKRINFSLRRSYEGRCYGAVIQHNTGVLNSAVRQRIFSKTPSARMEKLSSYIIRKNKYVYRKPQRNISPRIQQVNKDYGEFCQKPDMDVEMFNTEKAKFLEKIILTEEKIIQVEQETQSQYKSDVWLKMRRSLLTASNFGAVCKRRSDISCEPLVKRLIYKAPISIKTIKHGRDYEKTALEQLEIEKNIKIKACGLFIDKEVGYLGATPDGIIDEEYIVEIKCPGADGIFNILSPQDAIIGRKIKYIDVDKNNIILGLNKNHNYYYQIQGQLEITNRSYCLFAIWTGQKFNLYSVVIQRDKTFWKEKMEPKLKLFYLNCILPELVDSRFERNMPIRNPKYIEDAILAKINKK